MMSWFTICFGKNCYPLEAIIGEIAFQIYYISGILSTL